jgi:hypothetical protein
VCFDFRIYSLPFCQQTLAAVSVRVKNNWINTENGPPALETELSLIAFPWKRLFSCWCSNLQIEALKFMSQMTNELCATTKIQTSFKTSREKSQLFATKNPLW